METLVIIATFASILSGLATLHTIYCYVRGWWTGRYEEYFGKLYRQAGEIAYGGTLLLILVFGYLLLHHYLPPDSKKLAGEAAFGLIFYLVIFHLMPALHNAFSTYRPR